MPLTAYSLARVGECGGDHSKVWRPERLVAVPVNRAGTGFHPTLVDWFSGVAPDLASDFDYQFELGALILHGDDIAMDGAGKTALR